MGEKEGPDVLALQLIFESGMEKMGGGTRGRGNSKWGKKSFTCYDGFEAYIKGSEGGGRGKRVITRQKGKTVRVGGERSDMYSMAISAGRRVK